MNSILKLDILSLKEKLENMEKEIKTAGRDSESFNSVNLYQRMEQLFDKKDKILILNIGGKTFQTRTSTLLTISNTLLSDLIKSYTDEEIPNEIFIDRGSKYFKYIIDYYQTKTFDFKQFKDKYVREDIISELEFYGLAEILNIDKKKNFDLAWSQSKSKPGMCTVNSNDNRNILIHSNTCYTHFLTNQIIEDDCVIEFESSVVQSDNYYYIGIVNERYSTSGNCMCCNPRDAFYIQCDGSIHFDGVIAPDRSLAWSSSKVTIGMRILLKENEIYFYSKEKEKELGPFKISGTKFTVLAAHCNTGNGEITITESYYTS